MERIPDVIKVLNEVWKKEIHVIDVVTVMAENSIGDDNFANVNGLEHTKRVFEVAAAGSHNIIDDRSLR